MDDVVVHDGVKTIYNEKTTVVALSSMCTSIAV